MLNSNPLSMKGLEVIQLSCGQVVVARHAGARKESVHFHKMMGADSRSASKPHHIRELSSTPYQGRGVRMKKDNCPLFDKRRDRRYVEVARRGDVVLLKVRP